MVDRRYDVCMLILMSVFFFCMSVCVNACAMTHMGVCLSLVGYHGFGGQFRDLSDHSWGELKIG